MELDIDIFLERYLKEIDHARQLFYLEPKKNTIGFSR